jgi:hypothetical protein
MKIKKQKSIYAAWIAVVLIFVISIPSYKLIPFGTPDGLDFHNIYAYSTCDKELEEKYDNNIYLAGGQDCHDAMGREFVYPPLLFQSAKWVGLFSTFESARLAWRSLIILGTLVSIFVWMGKLSSFIKVLPFTVLLFLQFPMIFALERGNNDILVLLTWTLSYFLFSKKRFFFSGMAAAACVLMKVYPLFAFSIILGGLSLEFLREKYLIGESGSEKKVKHFTVGAIVSGAIIIICFKDLWYSWYLRVSHFSDFQMIVSYLNHSVQYFSSSKIVGKLIFLTMMIIWVLHFIYTQKNKKVVSFAGALAVTTYYSAVSYDYNLITVYPLILLSILHLYKNFEWKRYMVLIGLLAGVILHRGWFDWGGDFGFKFHMFLQVLFISLSGVIDLPLWKVKHHINFYKKKKELL